MTDRLSDNESAPPTSSLIPHLVELRARILKGLAVILAAFAILFYFANDIYSLIAAPLIRQLSPGNTMIATEVAAPFLVPFKLTLFVAIFVTMPYILSQIWLFIAPGLYQKEKKLVLPLLISSISLFYLGILFAYFLVFPLIFAFFSATAPVGVSIMTDIGRYLDFVLKLFLAFGLAFEIPVATTLMIWGGFVSPQKLRQHRAYVILGAFILGMLLTPPDVVSQILLAVPVWLLFEIGLLLGQRLESKPEETEP